MKLIIFFFYTLFFNILPDCIFTAIAPDSIDKISVRPKLTTPQKFFYLGYSSKYFTCSYTLYRPNNFGQAIC